MLKYLKGGKYTINLENKFTCPNTGTITMVFAYQTSKTLSESYLGMSDLDIRNTMFKLISAVAHCHSTGIMHRDIKPANIIVDLEKDVFELIDFGHASFYKPGRNYALKVGTRPFKAPEILMGYTKYERSVDLWSVGHVFAILIFQGSSLFLGKDEPEQLVKIAKILGTKGLVQMAKTHKIQIEKKKHPNLKM